jgi:hypothetical protein
LAFKLGEDKEGRPILYFCIRNFVPKELDPDKLALFNGVFIHEVLSS